MSDHERERFAARLAMARNCTVQGGVAQCLTCRMLIAQNLA